MAFAPHVAAIATYHGDHDEHHGAAMDNSDYLFIFKIIKYTKNEKNHKKYENVSLISQINSSNLNS